MDCKAIGKKVDSQVVEFLHAQDIKIIQPQQFRHGLVKSYRANGFVLYRMWPYAGTYFFCQENKVKDNEIIKATIMEMITIYQLR